MQNTRCITIHAKPGSKKEGIEALPDGSLVVRMRARAVDNQANERLIEMLAEHFDVPKRQVEIVSGFTGRQKVVRLLWL